MSEKTLAFLKNVKEQVRKYGIDNVVSYIKPILGDHRVARVKEGIHENRVVKSHVINGEVLWFYLGKNEVYLIIPEVYCSCLDFLINVVERRIVPACYHLVVQAIAEVYEKYRSTRDITLAEKEKILSEIEKYGYSPTLVRILLGR